jgi:hypothetical protein
MNCAADAACDHGRRVESLSRGCRARLSQRIAARKPEQAAVNATAAEEAFGDDHRDFRRIAAAKAG